MIELRPYQLSAVERARELFRAKHRRILLVAPTGAGKTCISANIIASSHAKGKRVVFFAHRRELISQTVAKLIDAGVVPGDIGVLMGDATSRVGARVQVASISTWIRRTPPVADLVFVDECHLAYSPSYMKAIEHYHSRGATVIGVTATPYRANGDGLGKAFDVLEVVAQPSALVEQGFIVAPTIYAGKERPDLTAVRMSGGDYASESLGAAMDKPELVHGIVDNWQRLADGRRTVVFASSVDHSRSIVGEFVSAGVRAEHLDGETPTGERAAILARLACGETTVVSNMGCLTEGWDSPTVKCCVLARPTKSPGLYLQMAGRILRPWNGVEAIILDHAGNAQRHGFPQDDREFSLELRKRKGTGDAPSRECPDCRMVCAIAVRVCPGCGYEWPPPEVERVSARGDQELVRLEHEAAKAAKYAGPCSAKQAATLRRYGMSDNVSFGAAQTFIARLARNGWRRTPDMAARD